MITNKFSRQTDLIKPEELDRPIRIIGAGGIGSWTTLALAKIGCQDITVQDFDIVDESNTGSQLYSSKEINLPKTTALAGIIYNLTDQTIKTDPNRWDSTQTISEPILIMALDNLDTRREIFSAAKLNPDISLIIDGRMSGDFMRIFFVPLDGNYLEYEKTLVPRESVDPEPCTGKAVAYNVFVVAGIIANMVKLYSKDQLKTYKEFSLDLLGLQIL